MDRDLLLQAVKPSLISTAPKTLAIPTEATRSTLEREKQMLLMEIDNYRLIMEQRTNNIRQKITKVSTDSFEVNPIIACVVGNEYFDIMCTASLFDGCPL